MNPAMKNRRSTEEVLSVNTKQLKWIFKKALALIERYENRELSKEDCGCIEDYARKVYEDSKKNEYCKKIMLDVICALNHEKRDRDLCKNREKQNE